jgi:ArsR family transcriptional regulator
MNILNRKNRRLISKLLDSLSKPARIQILLTIGGGEACVCHLEAALGYRQAYISQHLMALREAGILETRREGRFVFYRLGDKRILDLIHGAGAIAGVPAKDIKPAAGFVKITECSCPACQPLIQVEPLPEQLEVS